MSGQDVIWGVLIALLVAVGLLVLLVIGLLRSYGELVKLLHDAGIRLEDVSDPPPASHSAASLRPTSGAHALPISGETLDGGTVVISTRDRSDHLLLAFLSSGCAACVDYWRALRSNKGRLPGLDASVVAVTKGPTSETPGRLLDLSGDAVSVVMSDDSWAAYDVPLTPHFVLVDGASGRIIGEGSAPNPDALSDLMQRAASDARELTRRELLTGRKTSDE